MRRSIGSAVRPLAAVAMLAATTLAVGVAAPTAHAAPAEFMKVPTRLYMIPKDHSMVVPDVLAGLIIPIETMKFADDPTGDIISAQSRIIEIKADNGPACNHHATDMTFDLTGCTAVQLNVGNGKLKFDPPPTAEDDPLQADDQFKIYRFASGALLRQADSDDDLEQQTLALIGTPDEMNMTLQTLVYTPMVDDPATGDIDEDYYYDGSDPETLEVDIVAGNGDPSGGVTRFVDIKVLDYNDFPKVDVDEYQWAVASGAEVEMFTPDANTSNPPQVPTLEVSDEDNDEVIDERQDDGDPDDGDLHDGDDPDDGVGDEFLVVAWASCGTFSLWSNGGWDIVDDLEHIFDYVYDQAKDPLANDPAQKQELKDAFLELLPDEVEQLPFTTSNPTNFNSVFAGVADDIEWLNYNLGRMTFKAADEMNNPLSDTTCEVRVLISDLGNNGLPLHYLGDPEFGVEIPMFGVDLLDTNDAPGVERFTIQVDGGTEIDVTLPPAVTVPEGGMTPTALMVTPAEHPAFQVEVSTADGANTVAGVDYSLKSSQVVMVPEDAAMVDITPTVDALQNGVVDPTPRNYTLSLDMPLEPPEGYSIKSSQPTTLVTIQDDEMADTAGPTVTINQAAGQLDPTSVSPVVFTVLFSEPVTGFDDPGDVVLSGSADPTTAMILPVSATQYTVQVSGMQFDGLVVAGVPAGAAVDAANNLSEASTSLDNEVTFEFDEGDVTSPTVTIEQGVGQADPTSVSPIVFDVVFSEPVTGFDDPGDVVLSGTAMPTTVMISPVSATAYTVSVSGMSVSGTVIANVPAGAAMDSATNLSAASTSTDNTVTYNLPDATAPSVMINQGAMQVDPTSTLPIVFDVLFSEPVTGFAGMADVQLAGTAVPTAWSVVPVSQQQYTVSVTAVTQSGTVTATVPAGVAQDLSSNTNTASTSTDNTVTYNMPDLTPPTVTINQGAAQVDPTSVSPIVFDVVFSEPVTGFVALDVQVVSTAGAVTASVSPASGAVYTVSVMGMSQDGTVTATIPAGAAMDAGGNLSTAATWTDNEVTFEFDENDQTPPAVTIDQGAAQADPTSLSPIVFDVVFSEPVTGFQAMDVQVVSTAGPVTWSVSPASGAVYTVSVMGMSQDGMVTATIPSGAAMDAANNLNVASTSTDNEVTFDFDEGDQTPPSVTINQGAGQADPTSVPSIVFDVVFSEPVTGFATGEVTISGTAGAMTGTVTGSGATYTVTVTDMATSGTVIATIAAGVAIDAANHPNIAATWTDNEVTYQLAAVLTIQDLGDITRPNDPGQAGAVVTFALPTTMGGIQPVNVSCSPGSGVFYPLGPTTVTCTATDSAQGQQAISALATATDTFVVTVIDVEPPIIADNPDLTRITSGPPVTVTFGLPAASDNSGVPPTVVCTPPSGTAFAIGVATVTCTATDGAGNMASSSFTVTVIPQEGELPATGGDLQTPLSVAAATTLVGALLLLQRRRTRPIR